MSAEVERHPFVEGNLTKSEAELYDRQIRLWGVEAQNRIRASDILIIGLSGLGAEVAKNLILAGPHSVTLMDDNEISGNDALSQFLISPTATKANRAEASYDACHRLNPLVKLTVDTAGPRGRDRKYYSQFTLVVLIDQDGDLADEVNQMCRDLEIPFIAGGVFGWAGYGFFDFAKRDFLITPVAIRKAELDVDAEAAGPSKAKIETVTLHDEDRKVKKSFHFPSFADAFEVTSKTLPRRLCMSIPRSYFLVKTLLKFSHAVTLTDEILEQAYRHELDANSHFSSADETFAEYRLFTGPQLGATCAIVGGFISQEAIKALSQDGEPLRNVLTYNALDTAYVSLMPPKA